MQKKSIVTSQSNRTADELIKTLMAISIVSKKLANRVKEANIVKEEKPSGKEKTIVIYC